jgi:hypothetical protein
MAPGVRRVPVREGRVRATLFLPPGELGGWEVGARQGLSLGVGLGFPRKVLLAISVVTQTGWGIFIH